MTGYVDRRGDDHLILAFVARWLRGNGLRALSSKMKVTML